MVMSEREPKVLWGPHHLEGQGRRSTPVPKEIVTCFLNLLGGHGLGIAVIT